MVVVEADQEAGKIAEMLAMHALDQLFRRDAFLSARSMIGVPCVSSAQTYQHSLPDIFWKRTQMSVWMPDQMAEVDGAVGVGQGGGDEDFARHGGKS